ncbi:tautomerase family protein [Klebsiella sp. NPDC088457]
MPMTRIAISESRFAQWHAQISLDLQQALEDHFSVPPGDCFQLFDCYSPRQRVFDPDYLCGAEGRRSDDYLLFLITAGKARSPRQKQAFYQNLVARLERSLGIGPHNIMVVIGFTEPEDWSFGGGKMFCLADIPPPSRPEEE